MNPYMNQNDEPLRCKDSKTGITYVRQDGRWMEEVKGFVPSHESSGFDPTPGESSKAQVLRRLARAKRYLARMRRDPLLRLAEHENYLENL